MNPTVVFGIGNEIMGDDAVGLIAARRIAPWTHAEVVELAGVGWDILDELEGRQRALLLDSMHTGQYPPGAIVHLTLSDFQNLPLYSPHWIALPATIAAARRIGLNVPSEVVVVAMEITDSFRIRPGLTCAAEQAMEAFIEYALAILHVWEHNQRPPHADHATLCTDTC